MSRKKTPPSYTEPGGPKMVDLHSYMLSPLGPALQREKRGRGGHCAAGGLAFLQTAFNTHHIYNRASTTSTVALQMKHLSDWHCPVRESNLQPLCLLHTAQP